MFFFLALTVLHTFVWGFDKICDLLVLVCTQILAVLIVVGLWGIETSDMPLVIVQNDRIERLTDESNVRFVFLTIAFIIGLRAQCQFFEALGGLIKLIHVQ